MKLFRNCLLLIGSACFSPSTFAASDNSTNVQIKRSPQLGDVVEGRIISMSENGHVLIIPKSAFKCKSLLSKVPLEKNSQTKLSIPDGGLVNQACMQ